MKSSNIWQDLDILQATVPSVASRFTDPSATPRIVYTFTGMNNSDIPILCHAHPCMLAELGTVLSHWHPDCWTVTSWGRTFEDLKPRLHSPNFGELPLMETPLVQNVPHQSLSLNGPCFLSHRGHQSGSERASAAGLSQEFLYLEPLY